MIILGLDPGLARTGYGVIDTEPLPHFVSCGCLTTPKELSSADRLLMLGQDLNAVLSSAEPDQAVVETILFGNNRKTAVITAQARGVLLYILRSHNISIADLTPLQIKSRLTGYGQADKHQVQQVITQRLNLTVVPQPDDAADGLAAALCYADTTFALASNSP